MPLCTMDATKSSDECTRKMGQVNRLIESDSEKRSFSFNYVPGTNQKIWEGTTD